MKIIAPLKTLLFILLFFVNAPLFATKLPNPELLGSDNKKHHLYDFIGKGKWVSIVVWGPKCPACINEMPLIQGFYDDRAKTNIDVLGLVVDFPSFSLANLEQVQQFEEDYLIDFPNLLISANIYYDLGLGRLQGTPTIILVDPSGKVSALQLGGVPRAVIEKHVAEENKKAKLLTKKNTE